MGYFAGLDVSLEETAICIVDDAGQIVREARAASEPEALAAFFEACGCGWSALAWKPARWRLGCMRG